MVSKVVKGTVLVIDGALGLVFLILFATLLPGDAANANVVGSLVLMVAIAIIMTVITVPGRAYLRHRGDDLFGGIEWW